MIGEIALIVIALCCLVSLTLFLINEIKNRKTDTKDILNPDPSESKKSSFSDQIVGKTKTKIGQTRTNNDKLTANYQRVAKECSFVKEETQNNRLVIPDNEMDKVFYTKEEAELNVDVQYEYEEPNWDDGDDEIPLDDTDGTQGALAQGVSFDEMNEVSQALQNDVKDLGTDNTRKVGKTINTVEATEMFKQLVSGVNKGEQKIADILDRCEALLTPQAIQDNGNRQTDKFNIEDYM